MLAMAYKNILIRFVTKIIILEINRISFSLFFHLFNSCFFPLFKVRPVVESDLFRHGGSNYHSENYRINMSSFKFEFVYFNKVSFYSNVKACF